MSGPLGLVDEAVQQGARTPAEVARRTHLPADLVEAVIDHLVRLGRIDRVRIDLGTGGQACGGGGCRSCPLATPGRPCGAAGGALRG